jgi:tetratricopeptide (TPR) repeat protein
MKRTVLLILTIIVASACTQRAVNRLSYSGKKDRNEARYNYFLVEGLRQKYVGNINEAAGLFEKCIELDKGRAVPYFELAQIYSGAGMNEDAAKSASMAARLEPKNYWYQLACGSIYTQYQQKDSALVYFTRALKADRQAVEVNTILAGLYAEKGDVERADSLFNVLDSIGAMNEDMYLMMISGLIMKGDLKEAAGRASMLIEKHPDEIRYKALLADIYQENKMTEKSDSIYREIIERNPDDIESQLLYLMNLVYKKEYSGIDVFLNNVFESEVIDRDRKVAVAGRIINDTTYIRENTESAEKSLLVLENKYPDDEEVLSLRPVMYETAGESEKATQRYEELIQTIKPGFYFKERLILLYAGEKQYEKLYKLAEEYSRENNRSLLGKVYYAIAAMELKEYEVAESELKKAMILAGNSDELKVQVLSMMGDLKYRMKEYDESYRLYEEALAIYPDDPLILNNYAYFLAEGNRELRKALKMAEKVMQTEGSNPTYIDTYAWVLYRMGRYRDALKAMNRIFENEGEKDPELLEHMGYIKNALKKCDEAVIFWEMALREDPTKTYLKDEIEKCLND